MASFDPSIISQIPDFAGNPMEARGKAYKLADLITEEQRNKLLLGQQKEQAADQAKAKQILQSFPAEKLGTAEGNIELSSLYGKAGLEQQRKEALQFGGEMGTRELQQKELKIRMAEFFANDVGPAAFEVKQDLAKNGLAHANALYQQRLAAVLQNFPEGQQHQFPPTLPPDPQAADQFLDGAISASQRATKMRDEQRADTKEARAAEAQDHKEDEDRKRDARADATQARLAAAAEKAAGGKPPAGFQWDPDKPDTLMPIPGGPKDPNSKPWTGREKVFGERIITSANEAASAIRNITELPVGASTGVLGVGGSPGHSIYQSTRDVLRNKLSSQEVQDYNTMLAGVRRNLATIESAGLAPPGSLTESMSSIELREGDSQVTKLRKLAEMRQITDAGIEVQLADPAIPDSIKNVARSALDKIHKAVPFTHQDITKLQGSPNQTLEQLIGQKGLRSGGGSAPSPGTVVKGYRFKGGDPADKANWEKASG